jgi:hypothetical protein
MSRVLLTLIARLEAAKSAQGRGSVLLGADRAECNVHLRQAGAAGRVTGREPVLIVTGVPHSRGGSA